MLFDIFWWRKRSEKKNLFENGLWGKYLFTSDAPEPTFWRAEPSFSLFKNEPKIWPFLLVFLLSIDQILWFLLTLSKFGGKWIDFQSHILDFASFIFVNFWKSSFFQNFHKTIFLKYWTSRAKLFDQKLELKSELSELSLGSGATLLLTYILMIRNSYLITIISW